MPIQRSLRSFSSFTRVSFDFSTARYNSENNVDISHSVSGQKVSPSGASRSHKLAISRTPSTSSTSRSKDTRKGGSSRRNRSEIHEIGRAIGRAIARSSRACVVLKSRVHALSNVIDHRTRHSIARETRESCVGGSRTPERQRARYLSAEGAFIPESITARRVARREEGRRYDPMTTIAMHVAGKWVA